MEENNAEKVKRKKPAKPSDPVQQTKFALIANLYASGLKDEKLLCEMTPVKITEQFPEITTAEMKMLLDLQTAVGGGRLYSFLCGNEVK